MSIKFFAAHTDSNPSYRKIGSAIALTAFFGAGLSPYAFAYDVTDKFSVGATITGVYQQGKFSDTAIGDVGRGAVVTDIGVNFQPTKRDEFDLAVSFAAGNSLNAVSPYSAHPLYADDLEDDLEDINGRKRDYLLTAWYKHTFTLSEDTSFGLTGGIIDATGYVDDNKFANDEVGQFMNEAFVNNTLMVPRSFDTGIAGELDIGDSWSLRGVWMNSKNVDTTNNLNRTYNYLAGQLGFHTESGNYRLIAQGASSDFASPTDNTEGLFSVGLSLDQQLTDIVGAFARFGWQDDDATVSHDALYSGGINLDGKLWGRVDDEIGLAYAHLSGGNDVIEKTDVMEGYIKFQFSEYTDLSLDIQYLNEQKTDAIDPHGFVYGMRVNAYF
uniref:Porin n=1 Tax=Candidatus Kentrum sp. MB TaxID=2138164 RepID=A0A451BGM4_9GAMM|nr:MAG: porin [Candidatus Kentron sp. MB]VFK35722.1 MAG: porin [Candidatus Kentron sp. MB]VFK77444.1 MAG: porin [Candidatus Kentron sp. MB]